MATDSPKAPGRSGKTDAKKCHEREVVMWRLSHLIHLMQKDPSASGSWRVVMQHLTHQVHLTDAKNFDFGEGSWVQDRSGAHAKATCAFVASLCPDCIATAMALMAVMAGGLE